MASYSVLIIDNDSATSRELETLFQRQGVEVRKADEGRAGLKMISQRTPTLIILAVELPSVSGYSVCKKLKRHARLSRIPLFLISSKATKETFAQHQKLNVRADEYFHKPLDYSEFWEMATRYLTDDPEIQNRERPSRRRSLITPPPSKQDSTRPPTLGVPPSMSNMQTRKVDTRPTRQKTPSLSPQDQPPSYATPVPQDAVPLQNIASADAPGPRTDLKERLQRKEKQLKELRDEHRHTLEEKLQIEEDLASAQREIFELKQERTRKDLQAEKLKRRISSLEEQELDQNHEVHTLQTRLASSAQAESQHIEANQRLQSSVDKLKRELSELTENAQDLRDERSSLVEDHALLLNERATLQSEQKILREELAKAREAQQNLEHTTQAQREELERFKRRLNEQAGTLHQKRQESQSLKHDLQRAEQELEEVRNEVDNLHTDFVEQGAQQDQHIQELQQLLKQTQNALQVSKGKTRHGMAQKNAELEHFKGELERTRRQWAQEQAAMAEENRRLSDLVRALEDRAASLETQLEQANQTIQTLQEDQDGLQHNLLGRQHELTSLQNTLEDVRNALQTTSEERDQTRAQLEANQQRAHERERQWNILEEHLRGVQNAQGSRIETLEVALEAAELAYQNTHDNLKQARSYAGGLEKQLENLNGAFTALGQLLENSRQNLKSSQEHLAIPAPPEYIMVEPPMTLEPAPDMPEEPSFEALPKPPALQAAAPVSQTPEETNEATSEALETSSEPAIAIPMPPDEDETSLPPAEEAAAAPIEAQSNGLDSGFDALEEAYNASLENYASSAGSYGTPEGNYGAESGSYGAPSEAPNDYAAPAPNGDDIGHQIASELVDDLVKSNDFGALLGESPDAPGEEQNALRASSAADLTEGDSIDQSLVDPVALPYANGTHTTNGTHGNAQLAMEDSSEVDLLDLDDIDDLDILDEESVLENEEELGLELEGDDFDMDDIIIEDDNSILAEDDL